MSTPRPVPTLPWPADAELAMPGSKSDANRLLVLAALCGHRTRVRGCTASDDVRRLVAGLQALGFEATHDEAAGIVDVGPRPADAPTRAEIHCGNAGTALRFLLSVAAITPGEWTLTGDPAMQRRPIGPLAAAWRALGIDACDTDGCPPVVVRGGSPCEAFVALDASASSQFVSSLLLVGGALPFPLQVRIAGELASAEYARLTLRALQRFGVQATALGDRLFATMPGFGPARSDVAADGDWSSFGVWACVNRLTGSRVAPANLAFGSAQADEALPALLRTMPTAGDWSVDASELPDQFPNLAAVAALRAGTTTFHGGGNLRHKECDRIAVMARELRRLGADVDERPDGLVVRGGRPLRGAVVDPEHDHRIAMAAALLGLFVPGVAVAEPACVGKSYPGFWADLDRVVAARRCVAVVGMRGVGKSTFARAFAERSGVEAFDGDVAFAAAHGPIAAFVQAHGWPAFRAEEARLADALLQPGRVVALGGGAIETEAVRQLLRARAFVLWLDAPVDVLRTRLAADAAARPSVTGAPVLDELDQLAARREPLHRAAAHARLDGTQPVDALVGAALAALRAPCVWPRPDR
jgi:3-phosphoshikimate 1-carboxyvinyltransferase